MKIAFDARTFFLRSGVGRYTRNLLENLLSQGQNHKFTIFLSNQKTPADFPFHTTNADIRVSEAGLNQPDEERRILPQEIDSCNSDVVFFPFFGAAGMGRTKSVHAVHDLSFLSHADCHMPENVEYLEPVVKSAALRASHVIVPTRAVMREVTSRYDLTSSSISVIPDGVEDRFFVQPSNEVRRKVLAEHGLPDDGFLLYLGSLEARKGLDVLMKAYGSAAKSIGLPLVLAGIARWGTNAMEEAIGRLPPEAVLIRTGFIEEDDLPSVLCSARLFVYPSRYEGFGLPNLEAMAAGVPVVTTDRGGIPEVVGDAAITVPGEDAAALAAAMLELHGNNNLWEEMRKKGVRRARTLNWGYTAARTLEVLAGVAGS